MFKMLMVKADTAPLGARTNPTSVQARIANAIGGSNTLGRATGTRGTTRETMDRRSAINNARIAFSNPANFNRNGSVNRRNITRRANINVGRGIYQ